jgi:hypothetical protein
VGGRDEVLRDDKLRGFKIDIETDSTVQPDADAEKQARTELLTGIGQFSQAMGAAIQAGVMTPELAQTLIQWALRAFKMGASVEEELEGMNQAQALTPAMQQAQKQQQEQAQQIDKQKQDLIQREGKAKDAEHANQISSKDLERRHIEVKAAEDLLALKQQFAAELKNLHGQHAQELMSLVQKAEDTVRQLIVERSESPQTPENPQAEAREPFPAIEGA